MQARLFCLPACRGLSASERVATSENGGPYRAALTLTPWDSSCGAKNELTKNDRSCFVIFDTLPPQGGATASDCFAFFVRPLRFKYRSDGHFIGTLPSWPNVQQSTESGTPLKDP